MESVHGTNLCMEHRIAIINFFHVNKKDHCLWWDRSLIDWNCYSHSESGMSNCKVLYDCTPTIQYAGAMGLMPHQINSFTNHQLERSIILTSLRWVEKYIK
jgi:hypothetical protein